LGGGTSIWTSALIVAAGRCVRAMMSAKRRPDREDHCIVKPLELVGGNVASDADIPDKTDLFAFRDLIISLRYGLQ